jgi:hypothetical protein
MYPGLNQITGSFKYVVGAVGFTAKGVGIMFGAAVIIMGELALYSRHNWKTWKGGNRVLLWFFSHYVLMATLILTLQCKFYRRSLAAIQIAHLFAYQGIRTLLSFAVRFQLSEISLSPFVHSFLVEPSHIYNNPARHGGQHSSESFLREC